MSILSFVQAEVSLGTTGLLRCQGRMVSAKPDNLRSTGCGSQSVFLVRPDDFPSLNQMIDLVSRDGYVTAASC